MTSFPFALQVYSVRNDASKDLKGTLQEIKTMGYDGIELAGLYGHTPEEVRSLCDAIGLKAISAHLGFEELMQNPEQVCSDYETIGCKYIAIPYLEESLRPGAARFSELVEGMKTISLCAKKHGMQLLYHNHAFEFEKVDGKYALDILFDTVGADYLQTEHDTCWVNVGGENPAEYLRKYAGRAPLIHLQDYVDPTEDSPMDFRPIGQGKQDISGILEACRDAKVEWIVIEQDDPCLGLSALECARQSISFVHSL